MKNDTTTFGRCCFESHMFGTHFCRTFYISPPRQSCSAKISALFNISDQQITLDEVNLAKNDRVRAVFVAEVKIHDFRRCQNPIFLAKF